MRIISSAAYLIKWLTIAAWERVSKVAKDIGHGIRSAVHSVSRWGL